MTRWKLEEKATHPVAQNIGDHTEISYESFCALDSFDV
jgi:hypothetical protein